jgi:thiamine-monophosphate kinase
MTSSSDQRISDLGEFGLLDLLRAVPTAGPQVVLGPGDDAAVVRSGADEVLVSTDLLIENQHFRRDWSTAADVGAKAAAANLSDINAMGGRGIALVVGLGAPPDLPVSWARECAEGISQEAAAVGASVVGGDLSAAGQIVLAVTVIGSCNDGFVTRSGARPGDLVAVAGRLGWASAGFGVLARGFRSPRVVVDAHRRPRPPYAAGPHAAALGATAMVDVSDGLLADLGHLAAASEVAIDLDSGRFEVDDPLRAVGAAIGVDPMSFVLTGGDDYALAATFPDSVDLPEPWRVVGRVGGAADASGGAAVTVDGAPYGGTQGHRHFD